MVQKFLPFLQAQGNTITQTIGNYHQDENLPVDRHYTPRDIISFHMMFPEKFITDNNIKNKVSGIPVVDTSFLDNDIDEDRRKSTAYVFNDIDL